MVQTVWDVVVRVKTTNRWVVWRVSLEEGRVLGKRIQSENDCRCVEIDRLPG